MVVRQLIALPSQLQLISRLQHHIYLSSSLIFVSGEQGAGKSTILEQLTNRLPDNIQEAFIQLNEQLSDAQIRQQIICQWYADPLFDAQDNLFNSLNLLEQKQQHDIPRLIVFDNAQFLSFELLAELIQLIAQKSQLGEDEINVLLLTDGEHTQNMLNFVNQSQQNSYQECSCLEFKLDALSKGEANSLLNHVFKQTGYQPQIHHQDALSKQLDLCAGVAQNIIILAEQIIAGKLVSNEPLSLRNRLSAILLMFLLLGGAVGFINYLYPALFTFENVFKDVEVKETLRNETDITPEKMKSGMVEELSGSWGNKELANIKESPLKVGVSDASVKQVVVSEPKRVDLASPKPTSVEKKISEVAQVKLTQPVQVAETKQPAPLIKPLQPLRPLQPVIPQQASNTNKTNNRVETKKIAPPSVKVASANSIFTKNSILLSIPASHYTLQISAMATDKSLQNAIVEYGLPKKNIYLYETVRNKKPWYVVIFGEYNNRELAKKASENLPASLASKGVWVKKYQLVHQDLQLNNE